jgi:uncharacterized protein (DUF1330 family)
MTAYAVGVLHDVVMGPAIVAYLQRIDATLALFGGRFLIHGGEKSVLEGDFPGDLVVIAFPDLDHARRWYASVAYRAIITCRTDNSKSAVFLMDGVGDDHMATDVLG